MSRTLVVVAALSLCLPVASALARSVDAEDVATSAGISASLYSTFKDKKVVVAAQDDASSFIASDGGIRGAYLEAALQQIRREHPGLQASDEELATAILVKSPDTGGR
ncbi:DUF2388 domain-containing protein [Pseudomonas panipatensis]|uniref:DUF2388 domain-containing protein n=1 Tax=Pseudomonas panipatensis TaxID=428992 RepID=A0A1G8LAX9_9PSED|nr:DUF2388 domain-containing protein [Pseudomonas panipatensis]SDI52832.1 conserverd hypothetical protein [Pseudomonas panipatensis]SMP75288.1 conserverd hypothetical protein [Pseudomonas panipatensis]